MSNVRWLGAAHIFMGILLIPMVILLGLAKAPVLVVLPGWLVLLGGMLWRRLDGLRRRVWWTHVIMAVVAVLLMAYGVFTVSAATRHPDPSEGHVGAHGLFPLGIGMSLGALSVISLTMARRLGTAADE